MNIIKNKAFTLAEVLITLAIIGVIAAISVPSLIQKTNQAELKTAWKKTFAMLSQGYDNQLFDKGGNISTAGFTNYSVFFNDFSNYYKGIKKCTDSRVEGCWVDSPTSWFWNTDKYLGLILNNGSFIILGQVNPASTSFPSYNGTAGIPPLTISDFEVDVNGAKGPNTTGKDIFRIWIQPDQLLPAGGQGDTYSGSACANGTSDFSCSAYYLYSK